MFVEKAFDLNDWVVLICIILSGILFILVPKRLPKDITILIMLYGLTVASIFDNSFASPPFDYYDIMDGPKYTVMDGVVYALYPFSAYFFIYFYELFNIKYQETIYYILLFSFLSVLYESFMKHMNVFTYKNGFIVLYSFCIYLFVQSGLILLYKLIVKDKKFKF